MNIRFILFLVTVILTGCLESKEVLGKDLGPNMAEMKSSLNTVLRDQCLLAPLKPLRFNTSERHYDESLSEWEIKNLLEVSLERSVYNDKELRKLMLLVDLELFSIEDRNFIYENRGSTEQSALFLTGDFEESDETVSKYSGYRFALTDLGKQYIKARNQYGDLALCTGYTAVSKIGRPHKDYIYDPETESERTYLNLSYNAEFVPSGDLVNDEALQQTFPDIKETISRYQSYGLFSVRKQNGEWVIDLKSLI